MDFPLLKTFVQDFYTRDGNEIFSITYKQATIEEYQEFVTKTPVDQGMEIVEMIREQIPKTLFERFMLWVYPGYITKLQRRLSLDDIIISVIQNRFRTFKSIFEDMKAYDSQSGKTLFSANMKAICKEWGIEPLYLVKNYTIEQYGWLCDALIFEANSMDKKTKWKNMMALRDPKAKERAEETKKAFQK